MVFAVCEEAGGRQGWKIQTSLPSHGEEAIHVFKSVCITNIQCHLRDEFLPFLQAWHASIWELEAVVTA